MNLMVKRTCFVAGIFMMLSVLVTGCQNKDQTVPQQNPSPPPPRAQAQDAPISPAPPSQTPLKDALEQKFSGSGIKGSHSAIPAGTRLLSVSLENGVASVDVSKEFNALANRGETSESQAQKELRALLAQFPTVQKMRLTVEGKPFDSQATDWNTPFLVRDHDSVGQDSGSKPDSGGSSR